MKTKDKILATALRLFNERGLSEITLRTIASEMGISQGNLNYHFKKRAEIIEALYFQLVGKIDQKFDQGTTAAIDLAMMLAINRGTMSLLFEYRFLLLDFVQIMRNHPVLKKHFRQLGKARIAQLQEMLSLLQGKGLMRAEEFAGEYEGVFLRMSLFGDFWISFSEIRDASSTKNRIEKYAQLLLESLYPYFTKKGKKAFLQLLEAR